MAKADRDCVSPVPEDISDLHKVALGIPVGDDDGAGFLLALADGIDEDQEPAGDDENPDLGLSESQLAIHRWLMFANSAKATEAMNNTSREFSMIRKQILEELEWQRQGLFSAEDGKAWMAERDDELKRLRLKLASKRGWDAIRSFIRQRQEDKQKQKANQNWKNMFKIAKAAAAVEDKTLLDLYERYGFLGWEQRAALPYNPMFPEKNVKLAKERAVRLHQMAVELESAEAFEKAKMAQQQQKKVPERRNESRLAVSRRTNYRRSSLSDSPLPQTTPRRSVLENDNHSELVIQNRAVKLFTGHDTGFSAAVRDLTLVPPMSAREHSFPSNKTTRQVRIAGDIEATKRH